ncbi:phosphate ABC transporter substrate-binding protein PstS family protein [Vagococcus sp. CY52-2]|uniref:phosphate ABC transporter substrate-binding protein PstS family protein n=1 Tax=Vagococcus sp. CY52-2 TaxID=2925838 RepID=UPI001F596FE6|nr:phosphate ABC transporter substrate-binding protein PstS family protein [Vagococcus sp. CY52-2]UNM89042.1 phosphate ABC transporter substrate-binding protein PstS family protein [Vagococcus sp. CY52-2]
MKKKLLSVITVGVLFTLVGCKGNGSTESSNSGTSGSEKAKSTEKVDITSVGSTALQPLVEKVAEIYMTDNPNYTITVQGGGSGTGLTQVSTGAVDIGNSDVYAEEKDGIDASKIEDHKVAVVGVAPVVNKEVGVKNLTSEQLKDIFTGKVTNWKEVGGKDQKIELINRVSGSGTRATFEKWGIGGAEAAKGQEQDSSGTVRKIVSETPGAISYLAFSYIDDSIIGLSIDNVEPKDKNVLDNSWKIWAYEHMYTKKDASSDVTAFLDYMKSDDVQKNVVNELGYIAISDMKVERELNGTIK